MVGDELDQAVADCLQIHRLQLSYATPFLCWFDKTILFSFLCEYYNILSKRLQEFMSTFLKVFEQTKTFLLSLPEECFNHLVLIVDAAYSTLAVRAHALLLNALHSA